VTNCSTCQFFLTPSPAANEPAPEPEKITGNCRRFPPTLMYQAMPGRNLAGGMAVNWSQQASGMPAVRATMWCGEYREVNAGILTQ
jgi:hypothetical protein